MKQEITVKKDPRRKGVFTVEHTLRYRTLLVKYDRKKGTLHIKEEKMTNGKEILPPIFENVGICMACGKEKHVNMCGYCEQCWITFSHLRGEKK